MNRFNFTHHTGFPCINKTIQFTELTSPSYPLPDKQVIYLGWRLTHYLVHPLMLWLVLNGVLQMQGVKTMTRLQSLCYMIHHGVPLDQAERFDITRNKLNLLNL